MIFSRSGQDSQKKESDPDPTVIDLTNHGSQILVSEKEFDYG